MSSLSDIISSLANGSVVAFPTDTVFALACDALSESATAEIYNLKKRDYSKPLILFVRNIAEAEKLLEFNEPARKLFGEFMPGQLTIILRRKSPLLSKYMNLADDSMAVRIPNNPFCLELLNSYPNPLATTSANTSGHPPAKNCGDVARYFGDGVKCAGDQISNANPIPSTVLDMRNGIPKLIREGAVTLRQIKSVLGPDKPRR